MQPSLRLSPVDRLSNLKVVLTAPHWALAEFDWDGVRVLGLAWTGDQNNANDKGHPLSRGMPTWFILPDPIRSLISLFMPVLAAAVNK